MSNIPNGPYFIKARRDIKYHDLYRYYVMTHTETIDVVLAEIDNCLPTATLMATSYELLHTMEALLELVKKHGIGDNEAESGPVVLAATAATKKARMQQ
jgi:hypothetical protein